tara:strand:+ start:14 stop:421 length:408 start_codon:yes stop_codon:yes gene_type:complete
MTILAPNAIISVGDDQIDNHHKELFFLTSTLDQACKDQKRSQLISIIEFLETYVMEHFSEEETLMKKMNYPHHQHHQDEHEVLRNQVNKIRTQYTQKTPFNELALSIRQLSDQIITHIYTIDSQMAPYIEEYHEQ